MEEKNSGKEILMAMHPMWWMGSAWGIGMMLIMFVFWALIIAAAVLGIRWLLCQGKTLQSHAALENTKRKDLSA